MNLPELRINLDFVLPEADAIADTRTNTILPILEPEELDFGYDLRNDELSIEELEDDRDHKQFDQYFENVEDINGDRRSMANGVLKGPKEKNQGYRLGVKMKNQEFKLEKSWNHFQSVFFHESHEYEMYEDYEEPAVYDKAAETDEDA